LFIKIGATLIKYGAAVGAENGAGETPFVISVKCKNWPVARFLIANGACITVEVNGSNILHYIDIDVKQEFLDELTQHKDYPSLITKKATMFVSERTVEGATPFLQAVINYCNWTPVVKQYYYHNQADIDTQNNTARGNHTKLVSSHLVPQIVYLLDKPEFFLSKKRKGCLYIWYLILN